MPKSDRPYSRVYWEALDDDKFATVWDDDHALAAWLRLLVSADMAWPASAHLYHGVRRTALAKLCEVGLVDMQTNGRYRIHGLDRERARRSRQASSAAAARWDGDEPPHPASIPESMRPHPASIPESMPSQDSRRDEHRQDIDEAVTRHGAREDAEGATPEVESLQELAEQMTGVPYGFPLHSAMGQKVALMTKKHGPAAVEREWRRIATEERGMPTVRQLVLGADNALNRVSAPVAATPADRRDEVAEFVARIEREVEEAKRGVSHAS